MHHVVTHHPITSGASRFTFLRFTFYVLRFTFYVSRLRFPSSRKLGALNLDSTLIPNEIPDGVLDANRPAVTVRDVLRLALPAGTTVVGGDSGLDRAVTWARLIHLDHPSFERLETGELALAALPVQSEGPHALLAGILQTLAGRGISGLAVSGSVPPGAQALADAIGTPLLIMPPNARLVDIEKSVIGLVVNRRA